ncbi:MAG: phosphoenolpyruvate--protein phosphotransferase [Opitutae bacterium]|nr:phosphoenolpyruvate--protein phosphotransferase [Opitutae bacterium]MBT6460998.1 phosphoenolpyruvate--protein phosphotransferase [Opitutae bacterium]MBT7852184.1 phosphoenolpyruvate--protein phosphotransferase [Opitutae bacterium]
MSSAGEHKQEFIFRGIAVSPGVVHGKAYLLSRLEPEIPSYPISSDQVDSEIARFEDAIMTTRQQIANLRDQVSQKLSEIEAQIFDAHLLVLEDKALIEETEGELRKSLYNIESCFNQISQRYIDFFSNLEDDYIKERANDIRDVTRRLLRNLAGENQPNLASLSEPGILIASDITPSEAALIDKNTVLAIITEHGGATGHAVIMARSMGIPAIVNLSKATSRIPSGCQVLVDGYEGTLVVNPTTDTLFRYGEIQVHKDSIRRIFLSELEHPAQTTDGHAVELLANIEDSEDVTRVNESGAEGIGLFRSEGLYLRSNDFPSEDEQFEEYVKVVRGMESRPVIIRTLDLGGDKVLSKAMVGLGENNPFMGFRAIRFCLKNKDVFKTQLRALLRASAEGNLKILYPMLSGVSELLEANRLLEESKDELRHRGENFNEKVEVGAMIEIPSAAQVAPELARHSDFFSIGTNDLTQYLLAVDRVNDEVAHLYQPAHPAVVRTIKQIIDAAKVANIPIGVCGEIAGETPYAALLLGLGLRELSITPPNLPEVRYILRRLALKDMEDLASNALQCGDPQEVQQLLDIFTRDKLDPLLKEAIGNLKAEE